MKIIVKYFFAQEYKRRSRPFTKRAGFITKRVYRRLMAATANFCVVSQFAVSGKL
jgi:hypothetical protein